MDKDNIFKVGVVVALVIAVIALFTPIGKTSTETIAEVVKDVLAEYVGAIGSRFQHGISIGTNTSPTSGSILIGDNGSNFAELKLTTCSLAGEGSGWFTVTASTTKTFDCTVTGIASGDLVIAQFPTSTSSGVNRNWVIVGASASTTANRASVKVLNLTGGDAVIPAEIASSTTIFYGDI